MIFPRQHDMSDMPGMDMGGADTQTSMGGHAMAMKMYVHGSIGGDVLWFRSWQPSSAGATVGVCIGLFLLAVLDRYLHALWRACTAAWARGHVGFVLPRATGAERFRVVREEDEDDGGSVRAVPVGVASASQGVSSATAAPAAPGSCCEQRKGLTLLEKDPLALAYSASRDSFGPVVPACGCGCGGECGEGSAAAAPQYRETPPTPLSLTTSNEKQFGAPPLSTGPLSPAVPPTGGVAVSVAQLPAAARRALDPQRAGRWSRPFCWGVDVPRGLLWAVQTIIHMLIMLTVMTFQLWWIISVVVGAGVGEALFGRFGSR